MSIIFDTWLWRLVENYKTVHKLSYQQASENYFILRQNYQVINMVNNYKGSNNKYQLSFYSLKNYETGVYH